MRPRRILYADRLAHVFVHAVEGVRFNEQDLERFLEVLRDLVGKHQFRIKYYNLMPTHIHAIIQFESHTSCGWVMQNIDGDLATSFNDLHERRGHLWRARYKDVTIKSGFHLNTELAYVALNKVKAGILDSVEDDTYSSYAVYAHGETDGITEPLDSYIESGSTPEERQADFRQMILSCQRILKDVQRGRREEVLEEYARQAGIHLPALIELYEYEEKHLVRDLHRDPGLARKALFTREVLSQYLRAQEDQRERAMRMWPRDREARSSYLRRLGIPLAVERTFFADVRFIVDFVRENCPWILLTQAALPGAEPLTGQGSQLA